MLEMGSRTLDGGVLNVRHLERVEETCSGMGVFG
jgi:hypothetical protein